MLVQIAYHRRLPAQNLKAWSQNLGHESLLTTLTSYGTIALEEQGRLISEGNLEDNDSEIMRDAVEIARMLRTRERREIGSVVSSG